MIQIEERYTVPAPIEAVFALFSDPVRDPEWQEMVKEVRRDDDGPIGVGSGYAIAFSFMGRRMDFQAVVARHEAPTHYAYRSIAGPFSYAGDVELAPRENATDVTLRLEIEPRGFFGIIPEAVLVQVFRKQLQRSIGHQARILAATVTSAAAA
ncbi:MAG TPA: SRPBCC family protein [Longimicrobiaceae bacterium]